MYLFPNILGVFVFDENVNVVDEILFKNIEDYRNKEKFIEKLAGRHKNLRELDENIVKKILLQFSSKKFSHDFYDKNLELTKNDVKGSVN